MQVRTLNFQAVHSPYFFRIHGDFTIAEMEKLDELIAPFYKISSNQWDEITEKFNAHFKVANKGKEKTIDHLRNKFKRHPWAKTNADNLLKKEQCEIMIAEMQKKKPYLENSKKYFEDVMKSEKFGKMSN